MHAVVETDLPEAVDIQFELRTGPEIDDFQLDVVYVLVGCVLAYVMATR